VVGTEVQLVPPSLAMERYWCSETRTSISPREKEQQKIIT